MSYKAVLTVNSPSVCVTLVESHHPRIFYNFSPIFYCGQNPQKAAIKEACHSSKRADKKKQNTREIISLLFYNNPLSATESAETRALQNMAVWPVY